MIKSIFYKEWIKTRWFFLLSFLSMLGFTGYSLIRINRALELKGVAHIWEVMLTRDAIFIDILRYIPLIIGLLMAIVQFVPEIQRKCLKLTLHLPFSQLKLTMCMISAGVLLLLIVFGISFITMKIYLAFHFPIELQNQLLLTSLPWYFAGVLAYSFCSWIIFEPTWKRRVLYLIISLFTLKIFFISNTPQAYNSMLWIMILYIISTVSLSWISIVRFKSGKQD